MIIDAQTGAAVLVINSKKYGQFKVLIDIEDWERVSALLWHPNIRNNGKHVYFLTRVVLPNGKIKNKSLHRFIMNFPKGKEVDHIHNDYTDLRKSQLQIITKKGNIQKARKKNGSSHFKGVCWSKSHSKWRARICINRKRVHLLWHDAEEAAARAYDDKARELNNRGHHYALNFPAVGEYAA
jgi:hypothetical protein